MPIAAMVLQVLFVLGAVSLILIILVQRPQGGGLSAAFGGGGGSQSAFGAKTGDALTLSTVAIFTLFLLIAIALVLVNRSLYAGQAISPPASPSGLTVEALSDNEVKIAWVDESDMENKFEVERATNMGMGGNWIIISSVERDMTTYFDRDLDPGTTYFYRVSAVNDVGESPSAGPGTVTTTGEAIVDPLLEGDTPGENEDSTPPAEDDGSDEG